MLKSSISWVFGAVGIFDSHHPLFAWVKLNMVYRQEVAEGAAFFVQLIPCHALYWTFFLNSAKIILIIRMELMSACGKKFFI